MSLYPFNKVIYGVVAMSYSAMKNAIVKTISNFINK